MASVSKLKPSVNDSTSLTEEVWGSGNGQIWRVGMVHRCIHLGDTTST